MKEARHKGVHAVFFPFIYISEKYKPNYHEWKETSFSLGLEVGYRYAAKEQE